MIGQEIDEKIAMAPTQFEQAWEQALRDAANSGIAGWDLTPFLLRRISDATEGGALRANLGILVENARLAARIAVNLSRSQA